MIQSGNTEGSPIERQRSLEPAAGACSDFALLHLGLNIQRRLVRELRTLLDKLEPQFRLGAHQPLDRLFGVLAVVGDERDAKQRAPLRVHGGFLELRGHHLAEPLEAAHVHLGVGVKFFL